MRKSIIGMGAGILPWLGSGIVGGGFGGAAGAAAGLALAAFAIGRTRFAGESPKMLEAAAAVYFGLYLGEVLLAGGAFFGRHGPWLMHAVLAAVAFGSILAGRPFTLQYAREDWPRAYWDNPAFLRTNVVISHCWGFVFLVGAIIAAKQPTHAAAAAAAGLTVGAGAVFTVWFQRWFPRRQVARMLAAREDYRWSAPALGAPADDPERHDAIVVGAGIGGLTAAALLAKSGRKVLVVESHDRVGGYCSSWLRKPLVGGRALRFVFDAGVHDVSGLGPGEPLSELLRRLDAADRLEWLPMPQRYHCAGHAIDIPEGADAFARHLTGLFPEEADGIAAFVKTMLAVRAALYSTMKNGVPRPPADVATMMAFPRRHPLAMAWMERPYRSLIDRHVQHPALRRILLMLCPYLSDRVEDLTVAAMAPLFGYVLHGGRYPAGGSMRLAEVLADIVREHGGTVLLRSPVRRIVVEADGVRGIETASGTIHRAPAVVSNADLRRTVLELVGEGRLPEGYLARARGLEPATSGFMVTLGVDFVPEVPPIIMIDDQAGGVGVAIPSLVDPSLASEGHAAVTLMTLLPGTRAGGWDRGAADYEARKRGIGDRLIDAAETAIPGLSRHIVDRQDASPATFGRYAHTTDGAIYGFRRGAWMPPARTPIRGLCLAGAGVFPGSGVEAVAISGALAVEALMDS